MLMARLEIPVSGWTCQTGRDKYQITVHVQTDAQRATPQVYLFQNFIDVHGVSLFPLDFSFRLFVARTLPFLFGYVVTHGVTLKSCFKVCRSNSMVLSGLLIKYLPLISVLLNSPGVIQNIVQKIILSLM